MDRDWHEMFRTWAKPPSKAEEAKGSNAAHLIGTALRSFDNLKSRDFSVLSCGSYRNNTNVKLDSDIDVAVVYNDAVYCQYPPVGPPTSEMLGFKVAEYGMSHFRNDVEKALVAAFGRSNVVAGDKTINIRENTTRLDADVTPFLQHRCYTGQKLADGTWQFFEGAEMRPRGEQNKRIINWHQRHYDEGVKRNDATRRRFKRITRIIKRLRTEMSEAGTKEARAASTTASSFLIECLVYNATDQCFNIVEGSYYEDVKAVVRELWNSTKTDDSCRGFLEVSRMKYLFHSIQPWTRSEAHVFLLHAWEHAEFK